MRELTPRTITCNILTVVTTSGTGSRNTPCSIRKSITSGTDTRGITDNTLTVGITNNANTRHVAYTTLSNTTTTGTISLIRFPHPPSHLPTTKQ